MSSAVANEDTSEQAPTQPIHLLVYTSPGGLIDLTARRFAEIASRYAEVPFVVVNRPGGGGVVAFEEALRRPADGHTLVAVTRSNVSKMVSISRDGLLHDLDWLGYVMDNAHVLIARDPDYRLFDDTTQRWLGADIGGVKHVSAIKMADAADISMRWIPFSSGGQAVAALLGGLGDIYVGNPRDALASEDLHIVAVAAAERIPQFPDAPTFAELGVDGLEHELIWRGFATQQGVPEGRRVWLQNIIKQVSADPDWQRMWQNDGVNLRYLDDQAFTEVVARDIDEFTYYIGQAGLISDSDTTRPTQWWWIVAGAFMVAIGAALYSRVMRHHQGSQLIVVAIATALSLALVLLRYIPAASSVDPIGPRGVPLLWIALLLACSIGLLLSSRRYGEQLPATAGRFLLNKCLLLVLAYLVGLYTFGYLIATAVFTPLLLFALQRRSIAMLIVTPLAWLLFSWVVFEQLLGIHLPSGSLF